jgi:hypothetical protein
MEGNWSGWVSEHIPKDGSVPDEAYMLRRLGFNPEVVDKLVGYTEEEFAEIMQDVEKEKEKRQKKVKIEK